MYSHNGDSFFVVDGHIHFWDASPENWVPGQERFAKGWIECFHAYMGLAPSETHWPMEKFQKYSEEDFVKDVFEDGYVDFGIFQSTYLKEWYREGFNTLERNARLVEKYPDRLIANGRWDPREGDEGLRQLEEDAKRYNLKGVKLYTAEWYREGFNTLERNARLVEKYPDRLIANGRWDPREGDAGLRRLEEDAKRHNLKGVKLYTAEWFQGSRGWSLKDPESQRFLDRCQELGITNIHVHKGPTIWPLDKDAFDVSDVDYVATNFPELNFIVEHVGLPRIEDFCFMATQEPNVYAGLAVVIGGLMHARPRFFAKVMGELLFWVGEDKMLFASDYAIWEPRWQVEGFVDWTYPEDDAFSDYPPLTTIGKKKILGLNAAKLYGIDVPEELLLPDEAGTPAAREDAQLVRDST